MSVKRLIVEPTQDGRGIVGVWDVTSLSDDRLAQLRQRHEREFVYARDYDEIVAAAKRMIGAYSRELLARAAWVEKPEPWSPESSAMFETVLAREAETRDTAIELGAMVFPKESAILSKGHG
jgi:hypothetical protein